MKFIDHAGLAPDSAIIDVGGGASTLVDDLLARGFRNVTVLDLSEAAMAQARTRLGPSAESVTWIVGDITRVALSSHRYDFWHDRAVFHFLIEQEARERYVSSVRHGLRPGGHIVVATFGPHGPEQCSGLPVVRYSPAGIHGEFGNQFAKVDGDSEMHETPWGSEQEFMYCYCRLKS